MDLPPRKRQRQLSEPPLASLCVQASSEWTQVQRLLGYPPQESTEAIAALESLQHVQVARIFRFLAMCIDSIMANQVLDLEFTSLKVVAETPSGANSNPTTRSLSDGTQTTINVTEALRLLQAVSAVLAAVPRFVNLQRPSSVLLRRVIQILRRRPIANEAIGLLAQLLTPKRLPPNEPKSLRPSLTSNSIIHTLEKIPNSLEAVVDLLNSPADCTFQIHKHLFQCLTSFPEKFIPVLIKQAIGKPSLLLNVIPNQYQDPENDFIEAKAATILEEVAKTPNGILLLVDANIFNRMFLLLRRAFDEIQRRQDLAFYSLRTIRHILSTFLLLSTEQSIRESLSQPDTSLFLESLASFHLTRLPEHWKHTNSPALTEILYTIKFILSLFNALKLERNFINEIPNLVPILSSSLVETTNVKPSLYAVILEYLFLSLKFVPPSIEVTFAAIDIVVFVTGKGPDWNIVYERGIKLMTSIFSHSESNELVQQLPQTHQTSLITVLTYALEKPPTNATKLLKLVHVLSNTQSRQELLMPLVMRQFLTFGLEFFNMTLAGKHQIESVKDQDLIFLIIHLYASESRFRTKLLGMGILNFCVGLTKMCYDLLVQFTVEEGSCMSPGREHVETMFMNAIRILIRFQHDLSAIREFSLFKLEGSSESLGPTLLSILMDELPWTTSSVMNLALVALKILLRVVQTRQQVVQWGLERLGESCEKQAALTEILVTVLMDVDVVREMVDSRMFCRVLFIGFRKVRDSRGFVLASTSRKYFFFEILDSLAKYDAGIQVLSRLWELTARQSCTDTRILQLTALGIACVCPPRKWCDLVLGGVWDTLTLMALKANDMFAARCMSFMWMEVLKARNDTTVRTEFSEEREEQAESHNQDVELMERMFKAILDDKFNFDVIVGVDDPFKLKGRKSQSQEDDLVTLVIVEPHSLDDDSQLPSSTTLQTHEESILVSKRVLTQSSPAFQAMLFGGFRESRADKVEIKDVDFVHFRNFVHCLGIKHLHRGNCLTEFSSDNNDFESSPSYDESYMAHLLGLLDLAERFLISTLYRSCRRVLERAASRTRSVTALYALWEWSLGRPSEQSLKEVCEVHLGLFLAEVLALQTPVGNKETSRLILDLIDRIHNGVCELAKTSRVV